MSAALFPLFADLRERTVLVVGGGAVAARKIAALIEAGAQVRVGAPRLIASLSALSAAGAIEHLHGDFSPEWLDGAWLAIAATEREEVNRCVADEANKRRIWVNIVDDAALSSFHVPARIKRGPLQIAISSGGGAPMLARQLRERLEAQLDPSLGALAELLAEARPRIRSRFPQLAERRRFFDALLTGPVAMALRQGQPAAAASALHHALQVEAGTATRGSVALVGAGPGDPGLLTLRALRLLNQADVILHDRLVSPQVLEMARRDAQFIETGKQSGTHHTTQAQIHELMLEHAMAGRNVVRLKGGDPFVFGRGGEELEFLRARGIAFEVVPGITAALACAAYAGVPLTHRKHAQSVRLVSAHCKESLDTLDWRLLAQERQTLAVYMAVAGLEALQDRLLAYGRDPLTPFALVENGSRPEQRVIVGTLAELASRARAETVCSPALLILGEVAALATRLHWFGEEPKNAPSPLRQAATGGSAIARHCARDNRPGQAGRQRGFAAAAPLRSKR